MKNIIKTIISILCVFIIITASLFIIDFKINRFEEKLCGENSNYSSSIVVEGYLLSYEMNGTQYEKSYGDISYKVISKKRTFDEMSYEIYFDVGLLRTEIIRLHSQNSNMLSGQKESFGGVYDYWYAVKNSNRTVIIEEDTNIENIIIDEILLELEINE